MWANLALLCVLTLRRSPCKDPTVQERTRFTRYHCIENVVMETGNSPEKDFLKLELGNIEDDDSGTAGNAGFFFYSFPVWYLKRRGVRNEQRGNFKSIFVYMKDLLPDLVGATNAIAFCFYKVEFLISNFIFVCCVAIYLSNMHDFIFIEPFQYARLYIHRTY